MSQRNHATVKLYTKARDEPSEAISKTRGRTLRSARKSVVFSQFRLDHLWSDKKLFIITYKPSNAGTHGERPALRPIASRGAVINGGKVWARLSRGICVCVCVCGGGGGGGGTGSERRGLSLGAQLTISSIGSDKGLAPGTKPFSESVLVSLLMHIHVCMHPSASVS